MKRWFVFIVIGLIIGAMVIIPMAQAAYIQIVNISAENVYNAKKVIDVVKEGRDAYVLTADNKLMKFRDGRLFRTFRLSSGYKFYKIVSASDKYLWLVTAAKGSSNYILRVYTIEKAGMRTMSYFNLALNSSTTIGRIDVVPIGKITGVSPPKLVVDKLAINVIWADRTKLSYSALLNMDLSTGKLSVPRRFTSQAKAMDNEGPISTKIYAMTLGSSGVWRIYLGNPSSFSFYRVLFSATMTGVSSADFEVKDNKAYVVLIRAYYAYIYVIDLNTGKKTYLGNVRMVGSPTIVGMTYVGDKAVAIVRSGSRTYIIAIKDTGYDSWYSRSASYATYDAVSPDNGYLIPGGFFLPLGGSGYDGLVVRFYDSVPTITLKAYKKETYQTDSGGCYITFTPRVYINVYDNVYATAKIYNRDSNRLLYNLSLKNVGDRKVGIMLSQLGVSRFKTDVYVGTSAYARVIGGNTTWKKTIYSSLCFNYVRFSSPQVSSTYDGSSKIANVRLLSNNTIIDRKITLYLQPAGKSPQVITSINGKGKVDRTFHVNLPNTGKYTIYAREYAKSGPTATYTLTSNYLRIERKITVSSPTVTMSASTYHRSFAFYVETATTGTIEIREAGNTYTVKAHAGKNKITINLKDRGTHTVKVRLCASGSCSGWQSYSVNLYDYIEMWIDRKDYMLNGLSATMDTAPFIDPSVNRTVVPLRFILEGLSFDVKWNGTDRTITIIGEVASGKRTVIVSMPRAEAQMRGKYKVYPGSTMVVVTDSSGTHVINMKDYKGQNMGVPFIYENRTFVPVRFISEIFEARVGWDGAQRKVSIER